MTNRIPRPSPVVTCGVFAVLVGVLMVTSPGVAARDGDLGTLYQVNDDDPTQGIPNERERDANPIEFGYYLQDLNSRAELAFEGNDYAQAARYYQALALTLPNTLRPFRKLCAAYENLGDLTKAEGYCFAALKREGVLAYDHFQFLDVALKLLAITDNSKIREARVAMIDASLAQLREEVATGPGQRKVAVEGTGPEDQAKRADAKTPASAEMPFEQRVELAACQLGVVLADAQRLEACVLSLKRIGAQPAVTLAFDWAKFAAKGDIDGQRAVLVEGKRLGLPEAVLKAMAEPESVPPLPKPELKADRTQAAALDAQPHTAVRETSAAASGTSPLENWIAGAAAAVGFGAGGWLIWRRRPKRRGATAALTAEAAGAR